MMAVGLTEAVIRKINEDFSPDTKEEVARVLTDECGRNLPFHEGADAEGLELIHLAVLKLSQGDMQRLHRFVSLAQVDWRDLLVEAYYGKEWYTGKRVPKRNKRFG